MGRIVGFLSQSKLNNLLPGLIVFFASTQLGLHFWPLSSLVYGVRIDYLSPTLYFLDLLIILYLFINKKFHKLIIDDWLLVILLVNLLFTSNPLATLSWSLHFVLYFVFLRTVLKRNSRLQAEEGKRSTSSAIALEKWLQKRSILGGQHERTVLYGTLKIVLPLVLLFQTTLALTQIWLGHSVGGLLYYLGERTIAVGSPNIALGTFMNHVILRAYGTFGHPNVLAGYAVINLLILLQISQTATPNVSYQRAIRGSDPLRKSWLPAKMFSRLQNTIRRPGQTLWVLTTISIIILTQSRSAALALFGFVIPINTIKNLKIRISYFFVSLLVCWFVFPSLLTPPRSDLSLSERLTLQGSSLSVIHTLPIFGSGAQASISTYPNISPQTRLLQPDHNSFTLFLSWFGLFGVLAIIYLLRCSVGSYLLKVMIPLLPLLLLDHYLLTSPQGLFIFLFYLSVALNYSHAQKNNQ